MSQPASDQSPPEEIASAAIDAAFSAWSGEPARDFHDRVRAIFSAYSAAVSDAGGSALAAAASPASVPPALDDEARFLARLTLDYVLGAARITGDFRVGGPLAVTQTLGLYEEARRQLTEVRAGRATIRDTEALATAGAA